MVSITAFGGNAGAGWDWAVTENFSVGAEYDWTRIEAYEADGSDTTVVHQGRCALRSISNRL